MVIVHSAIYTLLTSRLCLLFFFIFSIFLLSTISSKKYPLNKTIQNRAEQNKTEQNTHGNKNITNNNSYTIEHLHTLYLDDITYSMHSNHHHHSRHSFSHMPHRSINPRLWWMAQGSVIAIIYVIVSSFICRSFAISINFNAYSTYILYNYDVI